MTDSTLHLSIGKAFVDFYRFSAIKATWPRILRQHTNFNNTPISVFGVFTFHFTANWLKYIRHRNTHWNYKFVCHFNKMHKYKRLSGNQEHTRTYTRGINSFSIKRKCVVVFVAAFFHSLIQYSGQTRK